jgi:hypothetical protein
MEAASPTASSSGGLGNLTDDQITEIQKRCFRILRQPPQVSSCVFCSRVFSGPNSWEERLEHVGGHMERDRKNGTNCLDISSWKEDDDLRQYLVREGIVEQDQRGNWRIGDGRPRRPTDLQMPSTPAGATSASTSQTPATGAADPESDSSMSKRRRGRPPKRFSDVEHTPRLAPGAALQGLGLPDVRPRLEHPLQPAPPHTPGQAGPSQHPTSEMRGPSLQPRIDSAPATPVSAGLSASHTRLEPYPLQQQAHHQIQPQGHPLQTFQSQSQYAPESSPHQRPQLLPNIMPRTPQASGSAPIAPAPSYHQQGMTPIAPAPAQSHLGFGQMSGAVTVSNGTVNLSQAIQQQLIAAAAIGSTSGPPALAPAPPRAVQSPLGSGLAQSSFPTSSGPMAPFQHQAQPTIAPSPAPDVNMTTHETPPASSTASGVSGLASMATLQQGSQEDGTDRPPSTGEPQMGGNLHDSQNRARTFREVIFER